MIAFTCLLSKIWEGERKIVFASYDKKSSDYVKNNIQIKKIFYCESKVTMKKLVREKYSKYSD